MTPLTTLSIYGSHDAGAVYIDKNNKIKVLEYERFVKKRYAMYSATKDYREGLGSNDTERRAFLSYIIQDMHSPFNIDTILYNELDGKDFELLGEFFPKAIFELVGHHLAHAAGGYYQSGFSKALILSVDGGGVDYGEINTTKIFRADGNTIVPLESIHVDLGGPYSYIGCPISEIKPGPDSDKYSLAYAGKVMGLCAYGKYRPEWNDPFLRFYRHPDLNRLGQETGLPLSFNSLSGQDSYDLAYMSQATFEKCMIDLVTNTWETQADRPPIIIVGGCALNVLFNQILSKVAAKHNIPFYVPPNPNDCGLAYGQFAYSFPEEVKGKTVTYNGFEILDLPDLPKYVEKYNAKQATVKDVVDLIKQGKIIGVVQGNSEVGPRALGNRSIICDPSIPDMKDKLNSRVKFREWYRPFAPVCRLEDKDKFFEDACEAVYMSYAPKVKEGYRDILKSITHVDGTSRLQTVTKEQHEGFYNILTELEQRGEIPVILNTSFNIKGKPILTTIEDAAYVLDNTLLDCLYIEGWLFTK